MQKSILLFAIILITVSCNNNSSGPDIDNDSLISDEPNLLPEEKLIWITVYDSARNEFVLHQQRKPDPEELTADSLIEDINAAWPDVQLVFRKISGDTLFVVIPDSDHLTQQMGSSGSSDYIATVTYSLTELKGIRFVSYDFKGGDHLGPGTFSRESFKGFN